MVSVENSCFLIGVLFAVLGLTCGAKVSATTCTAGGTECKTIKNSTCETTSLKCKCSTDFEENLTDGSTCVKVVSAKNCTGTSPCTGITNSVCSIDKCKCVDGFTQKVDTCVKILDSTCTTANAAMVCTVANSECKSTHCKCKEGYTESTAVCVKVLDSDCSSDANACDDLPNSACTSNKCSCANNYETTDTSVCRKKVGQTCTSNEECSSNKCEESGGKKTCVEANSAQSVVQAAGVIFISLVVTVFQKLL